jgi:hypothetical protein
MSAAQCQSRFWGSSTQCVHLGGHEGLHLHNGFALWDEALSTYPGKPSGGLLDLLEES